MIVLGNFFLAVAAIVFLLICNLIYFKTPPGGDAVVGYAWSIIFGILAFSICMAIVTAIIGWQGGFGWVGTSTGQRVALVLLGFLLILVGNGFFMANEYPRDLSPAMRKIVRMIPAVLPVLLLIGAALLLNFKYTALAGPVYKIPVFSSLFLSSLGFAIILFGQAQRSAARVKADEDFRDRTHQNHLNTIDSTDVMKNGVFLYVFTDANHKADVREKALAKIKSRPDWQEELVRRLQNDWAPEAFTFLASNEVDNKTLFPEAVRQGIIIQARLIRESIRKCRDKYDLYEGRFTWEIDRVIRTVDKFDSIGVDFKPVMQELRNALDEKTDFEKPRLPAKGLLDNWQKKH
ncbi:MAG: hypothetical protein GC192_15000 [Bacteroidetes bacterium]|nr:hypothetical protein [Bacteroidota bacterium]